MGRDADATDNRMPWIRQGDVVMLDIDWFYEREWRLKKSLNEFLMHDVSRDGILAVKRCTPQGQGMDLVQAPTSRSTWRRAWHISIQLAHHSRVHPVVFISRQVF